MIALLLLCFLGASVAQMFPNSTECEGYCMNISMVCTGSLAQFPVPDTAWSLCMASCMYYPYNATLSTSGDSYQCREYHLSVASIPGNEAVHCPHAGFNGGDGYCGTSCDAYCDNIMNACMGMTDAVFADRAHCMQECAYYPRDLTFNLSYPGLAYNNSVECRSWHSQVAVNLSATPNAVFAHCGHASPQGGGFCTNTGTGCDNYCDTVMSVCTGSLMQWVDRTQCMAACMTMPNITQVVYANAPVVLGNSLPCRKYHASFAGSDPAEPPIHCIHAGPLGGYGQCGQGCEGLCNIAVAACGSSLSWTNCIDMCAMLISDMSNTTNVLQGMTPKGSVGCATYWSLKALAAPGMCNDVMDALVNTTGGNCLSSGASFLQVSWSIIALVFLALGFTFTS